MNSTRNVSRLWSVIDSRVTGCHFDLDHESVGVRIRLMVAAVARRQRGGATFGLVACAWFDPWKTGKSQRHASGVIRTLESDGFPVLGSKPVSDQTAPPLPAMVKRVEASGAFDTAKRSLETCGQILRHAAAHGVDGGR